MTSHVLVIAGMHRSGTSLISQYLSVCGLEIGKELHNSALSNPKSAYDGHHEDKEFMEFHREILYGQHLYFPTTELRLPIKLSHKNREKALALVSARAHKPLWAWKDPETTLFLNCWHEILENPKYLFLVRHPLAVVDSLVRRKTDTKIVLDPAKGLKVWIVYNRQVLRFYEKHTESCLVCEIDHLIQNASYLLDGLRDKLGIELNDIPFEQIFEKKAFRSHYSEQVKDLETQAPEDMKTALKIYNELINITHEKKVIDRSVLKMNKDWSLSKLKAELDDYLWQRPKINKLYRALLS